ncbi:pyruvate dehydrogenase (acetyl-transferring) E1 component subunit alpha [Saccharospirillum impatiens]|uniref:pyruvate dehydrogenase (acetyl-transferring) E1 component subunit alpha n=1 Tax=Saccharospirillum impatiens TaxID=169438 RepID=UPI000411E51A|nr:pyruvate dehydrogenase (acetyl-transferring) E1 component subunit alpha [Saccharospirillum impatiens]
MSTTSPMPGQLDPSRKLRLSRDHLLSLLSQMIRVRRFEEKCAELYTREKIRGFLHLYIGEEAVAVGITRHLNDDDAVVATYREHGHALLRGLSMNSVMAEMYGKVTGCSQGRGGSMHLFDAERRFFGGNAIVGGGLPLAVGLALADKMSGRNRVTVCFFGEGAAAEGAFHESLNLAALWQLPVLFVCENNNYAMGTALSLSQSQTDLYRKAEAYQLHAESVDGMNVVDVEAAARRAIESIRQGEGPQFLECHTYRFRAHSMFDPQLYRDKAEVETWKEKGPILLLTQWMEHNQLLHPGDLERIEGDVADEIEAAVAFAESSPWEDAASLGHHVSLAGTASFLPPPNATRAPLETTYREACHLGLQEALQHNDLCFLMGEDVGHYGGCYAVSHDLLAEFGEERVRDTPLAENGFTGAGVGAALGGMHPIVEIMTVNFSLLAMDQIVNTAAALLHMSGGQFNVPLVIRMATGAGRQLAAQHSHSLEHWYAHVPGLRVLTPATLEDARYMLWSALQDPNPVLIFEHAAHYNDKGTLAPCPDGVNIDQAAIRRPGKNITLITYGGSLNKTLTAAEMLSQEGIDAEVIDLRVLRPLDTRTLIESLSRTHRAVIIEEAWKTGGMAAEVSAALMEQAFWELDAPIARVASKEVPIPYAAHLEAAALPQIDDIVNAARATLRGGHE